VGVTSLARYDLATGGWTALPAPPADDAGLPLLVAGPGALYGLRVSYDGTRADLLTLREGATAWEERPAPSVLDDPWSARGWWTGAALLVADASGALLYDPAADTWAEVADTPPPVGISSALLWSGEDLLRLDSLTEDAGSQPGGAAWRPRAGGTP
jgi:hypothetical protein